MKKQRQYRSNQGRSPERQKANYIVMLISIIALAIIMLSLLIFNLII